MKLIVIKNYFQILLVSNYCNLHYGICQVVKPIDIFDPNNLTLFDHIYHEFFFLYSA